MRCWRKACTESCARSLQRKTPPSGGVSIWSSGPVPGKDMARGRASWVSCGPAPGSSIGDNEKGHPTVASSWTASRAGSGAGVEQPRLGGAVAGLEGGDRVLLLQGQADVVQAVEQAVLAEGIDLE